MISASSLVSDKSISLYSNSIPMAEALYQSSFLTATRNLICFRCEDSLIILTHSVVLGVTSNLNDKFQKY